MYSYFSSGTLGVGSAFYLGAMQEAAAEEEVLHTYTVMALIIPLLLF